MLRILYIHSAGPFGGSSRSLFEAVRALPEGEVKACFAVQRGTSTAFFRRLTDDIITVPGLTRFDNTRFGRYGGMRWLILLRELYHLPFTVYAMLSAKRRWPDIDIIHQNEIVEIVPGLLARWLYKAPLVVHVRSVQDSDSRSRRTRFVNQVLRSKAAKVICIDETVRASLPLDINAAVIHNAFEKSEADAALSGKIQAQLNGLRPASLKVCFVGNLLVSKGVLDLVEAARIAKGKGADIEYVIVGGETRESKGGMALLLGLLGLRQNVAEEMRSRIAAYGLQEDFHFIGPTPAIQSVFTKVDVLTFPSHLDAPGRPIFEAAFFGLPSVVAIEQPKQDTMVDGQTGIAVPARDPSRLADAFLRLASDRQEVRLMGENARALARRNFTPETNAGLLLDVYKKIAGGAAKTRAMEARHV